MKTKKLRLSRNTLILIPLVTGFCIVVLLLYLKVPAIPGSGTSSAPHVEYTTNGSVTSQWLVVKSTASILSVSASNSGTIPEYSSLMSLNKTVIGYVCSGVAGGGTCTSWKYIQETGWYWDSATDLLYIHYLGGRNVKLDVFY